MEDLNEKIGNLKKQQEQAKELFVKCQGAIEILEVMIKEEQDSSTKKEKK
tara:strand:- start:87 stop:236 length:150 start_codon:yes stop_codon:yes gene_type:complete